MYRTPVVGQVWIDLDIGNSTDLVKIHQHTRPVTGPEAVQPRFVVVEQVDVTTPGIGNEGLRVHVRNAVTGRVTSIWGGYFHESPTTRQGRRNRGFVLADHWRFGR